MSMTSVISAEQSDPDIEAFRELPDWIEEHKDMLEGKKSSRTAQAAYAVRNFPAGC